MYCETSKVFATCKAIRVANCTSVNLHLCVNSPPLVWGENHRLHFAPFGTIYAHLEEHMAAARVEPALDRNMWDVPVTPAGPMRLKPPLEGEGLPGAGGVTDGVTVVTGALSPRSSAQSAREGRGHAPRPEGETPCALLPPERFLPFHIPFDIPPAARDGAGVPPYCELPPAYAQGMATHVRRIEDYQDMMRALECPAEVKEEIQAVMSKDFKEWLQRTGNMRQILDLMGQESW